MTSFEQLIVILRERQAEFLSQLGRPLSMSKADDPNDFSPAIGDVIDFGRRIVGLTVRDDGGIRVDLEDNGFAIIPPDMARKLRGRVGERFAAPPIMYDLDEPVIVTANPREG